MKSIKRIQLISATFLLVSASAIFTSCKSTKSATVASRATVPDAPTYTLHVKPIIDGSCGNKCHSASRKADGIDLSSYEGIKDGVANHPLLKAIKHEDGAKAMPRFAGKLDDTSIAIIEKWINTGMPQ